MENKINVKIKQCYDTEENYKNNNPILLEGQLAYTKDKYGKYKVGDGISHWNDLDYTENIFIGTQKEYEEKNANGEITPGTVVYITDDNDYYNIPVDDYMSEENEHVVYNKAITKALRLNNASENCISADITPAESVNSDYSYTLPAAGSVNGSISNLGDWLSSHRSGFYTMQINNTWYNVISNRHRNGLSDGTKYGMVFYTHLTNSNDNLLWDSQAAGVWRGQRTILDSGNYSDLITTLNKGLNITGNLNVNGRIVNKGSYVSEQNGSSGTSGLVHFMRIVIKGAYVNYPITLEIGGRQWHSAYLTIRFQSSSSHDPIMESIYKFGSMEFNIYYYKSGTSTWDFYANKNEAYGRIDIQRLHNPIPDSLEITFPNTHVGSVNNAWSTVGIGGEIKRAWMLRDTTNGNNTTMNYGASGLGQGSYSWLAGWNGYELRAVSRDHFLGAKNGNGYWGMTQPNGADNVWIRTTNQGIIPYQSGGRGGGHQQLGTDSWYFSKSYVDHMYGVDFNMTGTLNTSVSTGTYINSAKGVNVAVNMTANPGYNMLGRVRSSGGAFMIGCYNNCFRLLFMNNTNINNNTNSPTRDIVLLDENGNSSFSGTVSALTFSGNLTSSNSNIIAYKSLHLNGNYLYHNSSCYTMTDGNIVRIVAPGGFNLRISNSSWIQIANTSTTIGIDLQYWSASANADMNFTCNKDNKAYLGTSGSRWKQIYSTNSGISTSDRRKKREISYIGQKTKDYKDTYMDDTTLINFINKLKPVVYKRIKEESESGRPHHGLIAQDVEEILHEFNIDHAAFIKSPVEEVKEIKDENGNVIDRERIIKEDEFIYGMRYEEFISDIIRYSQLLYKKNEDLEEQLKEKNKQIHNLSNRLFALEEKIDALLSN